MHARPGVSDLIGLIARIDTPGSGTVGDIAAVFALNPRQRAAGIRSGILYIAARGGVRMTVSIVLVPQLHCAPCMIHEKPTTLSSHSYVRNCNADWPNLWIRV